MLDSPGHASHYINSLGVALELWQFLYSFASQDVEKFKRQSKRKYEEIWRKYEVITLLIYRPWDLEIVQLLSTSDFLSIINPYQLSNEILISESANQHIANNFHFRFQFPCFQLPASNFWVDKTTSITFRLYFCYQPLSVIK